MIIDTTYLLPLAGIDVKQDLLKAIVERRVSNISLRDLKINLISLFELQAKAYKLNVPSWRVVKAIRVIAKAFPVIPFYHSRIIETAYSIGNLLRDYIDSIILSTAVVLREDLITEDKDIHNIKSFIHDRYGIKILRYRDIVS